MTWKSLRWEKLEKRGGAVVSEGKLRAQSVKAEDRQPSYSFSSDLGIRIEMGMTTKTVPFKKGRKTDKFTPQINDGHI